MAKKSAKAAKDSGVSEQDVVNYLKIRGDFAIAAAEVAERQRAAAAARAAGLKASTAELQKAADGFRALFDLHRASDTERWMRSVGITLEALERHLETNILISKFKDKLGREAAARVKSSKTLQRALRELAYKEWIQGR